MPYVCSTCKKTHPTGKICPKPIKQNIEVKQLSKIIKSFSKGRSPEVLLTETIDNLSRHILKKVGLYDRKPHGN